MSQEDSDQKEISNLFHQDIDELSALLGQSDPGAEDTLYSFDAARQRGEEILSDLAASLRAKICKEWEYCERREAKSFDDDVTLATAVAGLIVKGIGSLPATVIATIMVKRGLDAFCECNCDR